MGDSITFGQYVDPEARWTALIDAAVAPEIRARGARLATHNQGISGETTRLGLERFPRDVQRLRPHLVTLQYGLNDCNCWDTDEGVPRVSADAYRANLVEMIERCRRFGAREVILSTNHPTLRKRRMASGEDYEAANARYSEVARDVAAATGARLCDIRAAFEPLDQASLAGHLLPEPDVLHLSVAGNRLYADAILPHVRDAIGAILDKASTEVGR